MIRKPVDDALLAMRADGTYDAIYERYFGSSTRWGSTSPTASGT